MKNTEKTTHPTLGKGVKTDPANTQHPEQGQQQKTPKSPPFGDPQRNTPDKWQNKKADERSAKKQDNEPDVDDIEQEEESTNIDQEEEEPNP